jgi:flavin-dependent dehydrogenase
MVHTDHDCVSLSCCIRRDELERCRRRHPGVSAGAAVLAHIMHNCDGVRAALQGATLEANSWRSAGPIRPGIRSTQSGVYLIGNAKGEAHPVVAEGISMAMQSAWLLSRRLISGTPADYDSDWRRAFSWRIRAASVIAHWAMRPPAVALTVPLLRAFPLVLTGSAKTTGKVNVLCSPSS